MKIFKVLLIFAIILQSCSTTKKTVEITEILKTDSVEIKSTLKEEKTHTIFKTIYVPAETTLNIDSPCDSLGNLKPINIVTKAGNFKARITSLNNTLQITISEIDSLISVNEKLEFYSLKTDSINRVHKSEINILKSYKTVKYRPTKWTYIFLLWAIIATALIFYSPKSLISKLKFW